MAVRAAPPPRPGLALGALRLYRRGRLGWAALATLAACLCAEQVIFAFPLAVWLLTPRGQRRARGDGHGAVGGGGARRLRDLAGRRLPDRRPHHPAAGGVLGRSRVVRRLPAAGLGLHSGPAGAAVGVPVQPRGPGRRRGRGARVGPGAARRTVRARPGPPGRAALGCRRGRAVAAAGEPPADRHPAAWLHAPHLHPDLAGAGRRRRHGAVAAALATAAARRAPPPARSPRSRSCRWPSACGCGSRRSSSRARPRAGWPPKFPRAARWRCARCPATRCRGRRSARSPCTSSTGSGPPRTPPATTPGGISPSGGPAGTGRGRARRRPGPT